MGPAGDLARSAGRGALSRPSQGRAVVLQLVADGVVIGSALGAIGVTLVYSILRFATSPTANS